MIFNLGNVVGLIKSIAAPSKKYVIWGRILNPSFPDIVELSFWDAASNNWIPLTNTTTNYFLRPVISRALASPPATPQEGDRYLVGDNASGAWLDKEDQIAEYRNNNWVFTVPKDGFLLTIRDENKLLLDYQGTYDSGGAWAVSDFSVPINPNDFIPKTSKGQALGVPSLDEDSKIPVTYLKSDAITYTPTNSGSYPGSVNTIWKALDYISGLFGLRDTTVNNIGERNAIVGKVDGIGVLVKDASADPTITSGWAYYKYDFDNELWYLIAKEEAVDINFDDYLLVEGFQNQEIYQPEDNDNTEGYFAGLLTNGWISFKNALDEIVEDIKALLEHSHIQNTDIGTSQSSFYIGSELKAIRINETTEEFEFTLDGTTWQNVSVETETGQTIANKYEAFENVARFTTALRDKLGLIQAEATKNTNTDELDEGSTNKYFTDVRAVGALLTGYLKASAVTAIDSTKSVLESLGILEYALDQKVDKVPGSTLVTLAEKNNWDDKYTQAETDNLLIAFGTNLIWKGAVATYADLATTYPTPEEGWTVPVNDELTDYRYDGTTWINVGNNSVPLATASVDGKLSATGYVKLRDIEAEATKNTNTDELDEGTTNKYFTAARAVGSVLTGYSKPSSSSPISATDNILQALGKIEKGFDDKLSISGDNFIATRPTANSKQNSLDLISIYNLAKTKTPGGQPLSATNRFSILLFPGNYSAPDGYESSILPILKLDTEFIDLIGIGPIDSIKIGTSYAFASIQQEANDIILSGFSTGSIDSKTIYTFNTVFRNLIANSFYTSSPNPGTFNGLYENITILGYISISTECSGHFKNIKQLGEYNLFNFNNFSGIIEECSGNLLNTLQLSPSSRIVRSDFNVEGEGNIVVDNDCFISYTSFRGIGTSDYIISALELTPKTISVHHCFSDMGLDPLVSNNVTNSYNTWDSKGSSNGTSLPDGTNIGQVLKWDGTTWVPDIDEVGSGGASTASDVSFVDYQDLNTGNVQLVIQQIRGIITGIVNGVPTAGNTLNKLYALIQSLTNTVNNINQTLDSDDELLDELQEVVNFIKGNRTDLNNYITSLENKVSKVANHSLVPDDDILLLSQIEVAFTTALNNAITANTTFRTNNTTKLSNVPANTNAELTAINNLILANDKKLEYVLPFTSNEVLEYTLEESIAYKIISVEGQDGQVVNLNGYTLGNTIAKYQPLTITVDKVGITTLIGERV